MCLISCFFLFYSNCLISCLCAFTCLDISCQYFIVVAYLIVFG